MRTPAVSIILPTYNRARFLPQAFESIKSQQFQDWELIIVDDGSTDNTRELVVSLSAGITQPVRYIHQENQGAYGARNTGLDLACGKFIAFYDSDDIWLAHHLMNCVRALEEHHEIDWVWGACRILEHGSGKVLSANTFYVDGKPRPFRTLRTRTEGELRIINDPEALLCVCSTGFFSGLQNSVIRAVVFANRRFHSATRNETEDVIQVVEAVAEGRQFAYFDSIHVLYIVHDTNSSLPAGAPARLEKRLRVMTTSMERWEELRRSLTIPRGAKRAMERMIAENYFWGIGYSLLWENNKREDALAFFLRGLSLDPWNLRFWKTYALARIRVFFGHQKASVSGESLHTTGADVPLRGE